MRSEKSTLFRSILKAVTYRSLGTMFIVAVLYCTTGRFALSLGVGILDIVLKFVMYLGHELAWDWIEKHYRRWRSRRA